MHWVALYGHGRTVPGIRLKQTCVALVCPTWARVKWAWVALDHPSRAVHGAGVKQALVALCCKGCAGSHSPWSPVAWISSCSGLLWVTLAAGSGVQGGVGIR